MGLKVFINKIFKGEKRENNIFIGVLAISIILMYNVMGSYYNSAVYPEVTAKVRTSFYLHEEGRVVEAMVDSGNLMQENIAILIVIIVALITLATFVYVKEKSKSISLLMFTGGSYKEALDFLIKTSMKAYTRGVLIGILLGIVTSPIYNMICYALLKVDGEPLFLFSFEGFGNLLLFLLIQFVAMLTINFGYVYRKDVMGLINNEGRKTEIDKRIVKLPYIIYVIIFLIPIFYAMTLPRFENAGEGAVVASWASVIIIFHFVKYALEGIFNTLKKFEFMYKGTRIIFWSNAINAVKSVWIHIALFVGIIVYSIDRIQAYIQYDNMQENMIMSVAVISIIFAIIIGYKYLMESFESVERGMKLKLMGYSDKEITECVRSEKILSFIIITMIPVSIIVSDIFVYYICGTIGLSLAILLVLVVVIPQFIMGIVLSGICVNKLKYALNN